MRRFLVTLYLAGTLLIFGGCIPTNSASTANEELFNLLDIYSYEFNSIELEHLEQINKWTNKARLSDISVHFHSIIDNREQYGYEYVFAKGYKDIEVLFVYSSDFNESKGNLHVVGIKGEDDDETHVKIKYDTRYILGIESSDNRIMLKNRKD